MIVDLRVGEKYRLIRKIGSGSFGDIYSGVNILTGVEVGIKLELKNVKTPQLEREARIYKSLQGIVGVPKIHWYGTGGVFRVLVIGLLGKSLEDLKNVCRGKFDIFTTLSLGIQLIDRMESIHKRHYIHRDIKPDNILMGVGELEDIVHVIDYGLSKFFRNPKSLRHNAFRDGNRMVGTVRYASLNAHKGFELSRRDDLEALGYCLVYLIRGELPWQGLRGSNLKETYEVIEKKKMEISLDDLCTNMPSCLQVLIQYSRDLEFEAEPDYEYLRGLLKSTVDEMFPTPLQFCWKAFPNSQFTNTRCPLIPLLVVASKDPVEESVVNIAGLEEDYESCGEPSTNSSEQPST